MSPASETRTTSYVNDYSNIPIPVHTCAAWESDESFQKRCNLERKDEADHATFTGPLLCVFTTGSVRPHLFRNSHLTLHLQYICPVHLNGLYRGSLASGLAFWKSFVISFPDFRNRFTCVAVSGNGEVDTSRIHYPTVGMPDIWRFIVTPFFFISVYFNLNSLLSIAEKKKNAHFDMPCD